MSRGLCKIAEEDSNDASYNVFSATSPLHAPYLTGRFKLRWVALPPYSAADQANGTTSELDHTTVKYQYLLTGIFMITMYSQAYGNRNAIDRSIVALVASTAALVISTAALVAIAMMAYKSRKLTNRNYPV